MIYLLQKFDLMRKYTKSVLPHYEHNRQMYKEFSAFEFTSDEPFTFNNNNKLSFDILPYFFMIPNKILEKVNIVLNKNQNLKKIDVDDLFRIEVFISGLESINFKDNIKERNNEVLDNFVKAYKKGSVKIVKDIVKKQMEGLFNSVSKTLGSEPMQWTNIIQKASKLLLDVKPEDLNLDSVLKEIDPNRVEKLENVLHQEK